VTGRERVFSTIIIAGESARSTDREVSGTDREVSGTDREVSGTDREVSGTDTTFFNHQTPREMTNE
jgi:hypothetical protein